MVAVLALATVAAVVTSRRWLALTVYAVVIAFVFAWWSTIRPSNDRDWQPDVARNVTATIDNNRLVVDNVHSIQVDWSLYGPKLAQVALTVGADDVDGVTEPVDAGEAESRNVAELLEVLDLEELDRDIYRGLNPSGDIRRPRLFGGQVAAQAARAASLTVPEDRRLHSLHGYFLRAGQADRATILHVDRDRDGRSFSARHVTARQDGEVILSLLVSFHADEDGPKPRGQ